MSTYEYRDLYYKSQCNKGKYFMVVADVKNSKQIDGKRLVPVIKSFVKTFVGNTFNLGDAFAIYYECSEKTPTEVIDTMKCWIDSLKTNLEFHIAGAYFDTCDYGKGNELYYAGYCFNELMNAHKPNGVKAYCNFIYPNIMGV